MPRLVTQVVAGLLMYGDFIADGFVPKDEQSSSGEKYYIQLTAPNLTSNKVRLTDEAYQQLLESDVHMGSPILVSVRPMVFNGVQYWRGESFAVRPDGHPPVWPKARPASDSSSGTASAASNTPNVSASASKSGGGKA